MVLVYMYIITPNTNTHLLVIIYHSTQDVSNGVKQNIQIVCGFTCLYYLWHMELGVWSICTYKKVPNHMYWDSQHSCAASSPGFPPMYTYIILV